MGSYCCAVDEAPISANLDEKRTTDRNVDHSKSDEDLESTNSHPQYEVFFKYHLLLHIIIQPYSG